MIIENYICSFLLIVFGLYTVLVKKNLIKIVIGLSLINYGINLLFVSVGFKAGGTESIFTLGEIKPETFFVDPVPQALALTSIVIGVCVTAMALSFVIKIKEKFGTIDADKIRRLNG